MREILFRGKRADNGEWETGSLVIIRDGCSDKEVFIADKMTGYHTPVIPETVGQYTGLHDKNGRKIFEGDIVEYGGTHHQVVFEKRCGNAYFGIVMSEIETWGFSNVTPANGMEVIGNIYDNPELMGGWEEIYESSHT